MLYLGQDLICFLEMFIFVLTWLVLRIMMVFQWFFMASASMKKVRKELTSSMVVKVLLWKRLLLMISLIIWKKILLGACMKEVVLLHYFVMIPRKSFLQQVESHVFIKRVDQMVLSRDLVREIVTSQEEEKYVKSSN
ncbi:hypothetical protein O6H91_10G040100 [Diphasiastrum complanatum]|uniref:Uncharacterized protein n=1 Tax=Diphasiastrum complanatum TaxID=34168 RepID=A0ACC2CGE3_DIPCM|nr:hypothetical protein O6H91_10G040100 [Diphasiastrum complanatum]